MSNTFFSKLSVRIAAGLGTLYLLWGSTYLGIKYAIATIPPYFMSSSRFIVAGLILYAWAVLKGAERPNLRHWRSAAIVGGFLLLGGNASVAWAEQHVPSSIASLIIATMPLWMVMMDWLWQKQERPSGRVFAGIALGFVGIALLVRPQNSGELMAFEPVGIFALMLAAILWSTGSLYSRNAYLPKSKLQGIGMQMIAGGGMVFLAGLARGEWAEFSFANISQSSFLAWLYLLIFGSMIGFSCYIWLLKVAPADRVSTYAYVNPVVAVFLGWLFLDEPVTTQTAIASAIIILSVVLIINRKRSSAPQVEAVKPAVVPVKISSRKPVQLEELEP
ncbi:MAG: EamA family transporter [Calditrichia bacterium]|nr:EamA family transporter [Calditrichota bacterium]MCB0286930.1 EamA family transporter [Calditrichota bacterium]MCB9066707.1 EamA family transporter [Calditrichia bacterium]